MRKHLVGAVLSLAALAVNARPPAFDAYLVELHKVEAASGPVSLEPLFVAADAVQLAAMHIDGEEAWLEKLSDAAYAVLQAELRGFILSRGYDIYAQPDPDFLLRLARAHGRPQDLDFFTLYRQYWSDNYNPVFQRLGDRATPCVRYGERVLPEVYEAWRGYARRHPDTYMGFAEQTLRDVEEMQTLGTCACGDKESVMREQREFLKRFPETQVADQVRARLKQLREDPDKRPIHCR